MGQEAIRMWLMPGAGRWGCQWEVWKASSAVRFWSIRTARQNQASGSVSEGLSYIIPARAVEALAELHHYRLRVSVAGVLNEVLELIEVIVDHPLMMLTVG